jgi:glutamine cyclotransferase
MEANMQGLFYDDEVGGHFIECTGMWGQSSIRRLRVSDGKIVQSRTVSDGKWFGEGCFKARAGVGVMMTWQNNVAFEFNTTTFEEIRQIPWPREGWGISGDGGSKVYATDGSNTLFSLDPKTYADVTSKSVKLAGQSDIQTSRLNEVELVDNEVGYCMSFFLCSPVNFTRWYQILANVWGENYILRIDPETVPPNVPDFELLAVDCASGLGHGSY